MTDDFAGLFAFHRWADRKVLDACRELTPTAYVALPAPGWSSVRTTLVHLATVTEGWLRGFVVEEVTGVPTEDDLITIDDLERYLVRVDEHLAAILPQLTPEFLATPRLFRRRGQGASLPPWAVLRHVVNHATYHRGQVASKLARFGVQPPSIDLIFWVMERQAAG